MQQQLRIIEAGKIFDGHAQSGLRNNVSIVIENSQILDVLPTCEARRKYAGATKDANVLDAKDMSVIPGIVDAHVHTRSSGDPIQRMCDPYRTQTADIAFRSLLNAQAALASGITSIGDMASVGYVDVSLRDYIERDQLLGPTMRVSGRGLTMYGGHMDPPMREETHLRDHTGLCNTPDEARSAARYQISRGVDMVKLNVTDHMDLERGFVRQEMDLDMIEAATAQAHKAGLLVAAHCNGGSGATDAITAGIDALQHGWFLTEQQLHDMAEAGIYYVPTLSPPRKRLKARDCGLPVNVPEERDVLGARVSAQRLMQAHKIGVKIAAGSDAGTLHNTHGTNAWEIVFMVEAGMSTMRALEAGTATAAAAIGLGDRKGRIAAGFDADLVLLSMDPTEDITAIVNAVFRVYRKGCPVKIRSGDMSCASQ